MSSQAAVDRPVRPRPSQGLTDHATERAADPSVDGRARYKEGLPSMDSRTAAPPAPGPDATEFIRFCYRRRRVGWPEIYDEMCAVAGRGLFRGYGPDDLADMGIRFGLFDLPALASLASQVVEQERARRGPVAVRIVEDADPPSPPGDDQAIIREPSLDPVGLPIRA